VAIVGQYGSVSQIPARVSCEAGLSDQWKLHEGGYSESKAFAYRKDLKVVSAVDDQNDVIDPKALSIEAMPTIARPHPKRWSGQHQKLVAQMPL